MRDYAAWHEAYGEPGSPLWNRLQVVIELIGVALDGSAPGTCRFVSLCAGQGHDVVSVAANHPRGPDLVGRLVELDPVNAAAAGTRVGELGLTGIDVRTADAGNTDACAGAVPADLVVACGIFGNISLDDIQRTIEALPSVCAARGWVVWSRHPREAGVLDSIEGWFQVAGFERHTVVVDEEQGFAVALHRLTVPPVPFQPSRPLFRFTR